jgi:hypothetical protein
MHASRSITFYKQPRHASYMTIIAPHIPIEKQHDHAYKAQCLSTPWLRRFLRYTKRNNILKYGAPMPRHYQFKCKNIAVITINGTSRYLMKLHCSIYLCLFTWMAMRAPVVTKWGLLLLMHLIAQEGALVTQPRFGIHPGNCVNMD